MSQLFQVELIARNFKIADIVVLLCWRQLLVEEGTLKDEAFTSTIKGFPGSECTSRGVVVKASLRT